MITNGFYSIHCLRTIQLIYLANPSRISQATSKKGDSDSEIIHNMLSYDDLFDLPKILKS